MKTKGLPFLSLLLILAADLAHGDSAAWNLNPTSGDWNTAANWTPNTVPNGPDDIATFELSNQTDISVSLVGEVNELIFNPGASAFTVTVVNDPEFTISGTGITNNSGIAQNFVVTGSLTALVMANSATAGDMTVFTVTSGNPFGGFLIFFNTASADHGTFVIESEPGSGGALIFADDSTAGNGSFTVNGGNEPGNISFQGGTAGNGLFLINGGTKSGAFGGSVLFSGGTAGNATLIANPGTNGGGGGLIKYAFTGVADQSEARIELFGNGTLDMTYGVNGGRTVGSIEGDGLVMLGGNLLITGANNLSTTFSGTIDTGSLTKIGTGTLTLTGTNTYTGGTTIEGGKLVVNNRTASGTGTGPVQVEAGTLAGRGTIAGLVTVGTGSGPGALLAPGRRGGKPDTLTIQSALTFNSDAIYYCGLNTRSVRADEVVANGVTINSAQFSLVGRGGVPLPAGTVLKVINNTAATPIEGSFANLPDGSTFIAHGNAFEVNYQGGDGNDLTLTVVP